MNLTQPQKHLVLAKGPGMHSILNHNSMNQSKIYWSVDPGAWTISITTDPLVCPDHSYKQPVHETQPSPITRGHVLPMQ